MVSKFMRIISMIILFSVLLSCSPKPKDPTELFWGQWEYCDTENGYDAFRYDIEFVSDGTFLIPDTPLMMVNTFEYGFLDGNRLRLTAMGNSIIMEYEIEGDILKLIFDQGYNLYRRSEASMENKLNGQSSYSFCNKIKDIPIKECEALVVLYESMNGEVWENNEFWFITKRVKFWNGVEVKDGHVTSLQLDNNQLTGSIPPELGNLSNLEGLNLFANQLTGSIPPELGNLSNLEGLNLFANQLTGSIPPELGNLSNLEGLDLGHNQLTGSIPPELGNLSNLERLNLGHNQLTGSMPPELGNLSNLERLDLDFNQLSGSVPLSLVNLTNLQYFSTAGNYLCEPSTLEFKAWKETVEKWNVWYSCN